MLTNPAEGGETESIVLGPFYHENPPVLPKGASTILKHCDNEETVHLEGDIRDRDGAALTGVTIDIWEDAPNGLDGTRDHDQPGYELRRRVETDANGRFPFVAARLMPYPIPDDVTAGELIRATATTRTGPGTSISSSRSRVMAHASVKSSTHRRTGSMTTTSSP